MVEKVMGNRHGVWPNSLGCCQEGDGVGGGKGEALQSWVFEKLGILTLTMEPPPGLGKGHQSSNSNSRCTGNR